MDLINLFDQNSNFSQEEVQETSEDQDVIQEEKDDILDNDDEDSEEEPEEKQTSEEDSEEEDEKVSSSQETENTVVADLALDLKDNGIFTVIGEDEITSDLSPDKLQELIEKEVDGRLEQEISNFAEGLDDEAKAFLEFKRNGGKTSDFLSIYNNQGIDYDSIDVQDEDHQNLIIRKYLKDVKGESKEDIDEQLMYFADKGTKGQKAAQFLLKLKSAEETQRQQILQDQAQKREKAVESIKKFNESMVSTIDSIQDVNGFTIPKNDKDKLKDFMFKPKVKQGNAVVTPFQQKMSEIFKAETPEAKQKLALLGSLVMNDFNAKPVAKKIEKDVVKNVKSRLAQHNKTSSKNRGTTLIDILQ